jgi:hypothetical protein
MAFNKTLLSDQHVVTEQQTGLSPKYKGQMVTTIKMQNLRTNMTKTAYVVHSYRNCKNWTNIISYPDHGFVLTNVYDKDLSNINADSQVQIVEHIDFETAQEIARLSAELNSKKSLPQPIIEESKPKKTSKPTIDFDLFKKNFTFGE